jgi:Carboxypeptidase regulatory-like domain
MRLLILTLILSTALVASQLPDHKDQQASAPNENDRTKSACVFGIVKDSIGLLAREATVTLTDVDVRVSQSTSTDLNGSYIFCKLLAGTYTLSATRGIAKTDTRNISLKKDERESVNLVLH